MRRRPENKIQKLRGARPTISIGGGLYTRAEVYDSYDLKKQLVNENVKSAFDLYITCRDEEVRKELGGLFYLKYKDHPDYNGAAFHMAQELGVSRLLGLKSPANPVTKGVDEFEEKIFEKVRKKDPINKIFKVFVGSRIKRRKRR